MRRVLFALAAAALLAGCSSGTVYPLPVAEARATLEATALPPLVFGSETPDFKVTSSATQVTWTLERGGAELMHYTANLTPDGDQATRVRVELKGATEGPYGDSDKRLSANPTIKHMYEVAVQERIASALEHRDFDLTRVYPALTAATVANIPRLQSQVDEVAAASAAADRANIEKAYAEEAKGRR